jgi:hypothetical protein
MSDQRRYTVAMNLKKLSIAGPYTHGHTARQKTVVFDTCDHGINDAVLHRNLVTL